VKISAAGERRGKEGIKEEKGRGERRRRVEGRGGERRGKTYLSSVSHKTQRLHLGCTCRG